MPLTDDASANIAELTRAHPEWPKDRRIAAGLNAAREHSADIPKKDKQAAQRKALEG
jgi:hypothetical protein